MQDEKLCWQGRPAPRCYVFRKFPLLLAAALAGILAAAVLWWTSLPLRTPLGGGLLVLAGTATVLGPGCIGYRRWRWEGEFYALTDQRLLMRVHGQKTPAVYLLTELQGVSVHRYSEQLATIHLAFRGQGRVTLQCLEQPRACLEVLQRQGFSQT